MSSGLSFWGEIVPNWIGAVGGAAGTVIAGVAFVQGRRNKAGIRNIANASRNPPTASGVASPISGGSRWSPERGGVRWELVNPAGERFKLVNTGNQTAHVLLFGLGEGAQLELHTTIPGDVAPGDAIEFDWVKSWTEPTAVSYSVQWTDDANPGYEQWETLGISR
ncbi:hypothetical protein FA014_01975 [Cellulomonas hominis]|uniref:Uncharacterized protein n=1 Tax=Cellulomonas hominis TaxID=156981 RepID=A0A7Z8NRU3_9CELL|nr:hypothetical protein [Cellulomonas hominis]TKR27148.1 hypothetical protein FA014_01975 [Cellulomonas hominis]